MKLLGPLHRLWTRVPVDHAHLSGKFDRDPELLRDQVLEEAAWASIITLTEVNLAVRAAVLAEIDGFALTRGENGADGEVALLTLADTWRVRDWATHVLDDQVPGGARDTVVALIALLEHVETGATLLVSTAHLPSDVEGSWRSRGARVVAYLRCIARWRRLVRRWRRKHKPDGELATADFNLNLFRLWVRAMIRVAWPAMKPPARKRTGTRGDLGKRLISWALGRNVHDLELEVTKHHPASDHWIVRLRYVIRHRKKKEHR